jgi:hypothetical protein
MTPVRRWSSHATRSLAWKSIGARAGSAGGVASPECARACARHRPHVTDDGTGVVLGRRSVQVDLQAHERLSVRIDYPCLTRRRFS